ncbi:MAG: DUF1828 domain-containing protein [Candidatus Schekmanbacteria bacterium]|nr:DUF1828 domain-containing protein [Candidatus Schekmanbacteria bacterium]
MVDVPEIQRQVAGHHLVRSVDELRTGHVRIETGFLYPEGSAVDLFIVHDRTLFPRLCLSDLGQTIAWLADVQVRPWLSKKRQAFLNDVLRLYGVAQAGGALELTIPSWNELVPGIMRLGQACVRVADLVFTRRTSLQAPVTEEVEEVLAEGALDYETNPELEGRFGNRVRVDFLVHGRRMPLAVLTWSSANRSQAHVQANEIFRRWYDLDIPARREQRVTILDDRFDVYRDDDMKRLREKSDMLGLSDRVGILDVLSAA